MICFATSINNTIFLPDKQMAALLNKRGLFVLTLKKQRFNLGRVKKLSKGIQRFREMRAEGKTTF